MYRVILSVLSGFSLLLPTLANEAAAAVDTNCTTLEPIFIPQFLGTVTKYKSTTVVTTKVDCSGCVLSSRTYSGAVLPPSGSPTTVTSPLLTSISAVCRRSPPVTTTTSLPPITLPKAVVTGTNAPLPSIAPLPFELIKDLTTAFIYVTLLSDNPELLREICGSLNPARLDKIAQPPGYPGINGTAIRNEVCYVASLNAYYPKIAELVTEGQPADVPLIARALFAVQVASGFAGGTDLNKLCVDLNPTLLNGLFQGFTAPDAKTGNQIQDYVCGVAKRGN